MKTLEILRDARALVANGWTTRTYARAADGLPVGATDARAVSFCMLGAVCRAHKVHTGAEPQAGGAVTNEWRDCVSALQAGLPHSPVGNNAFDLAPFNDGHTRGDVLEVFDRAIARVGGLPQ